MSADGKRAVSLAIKNQGIPFQLLSIYKTDGVQPIKQFHLQHERPNSFALTNDGKKTLQGTGNWNLYVWDNETGKLLHTFRHFASIHGISCSNDNKLVYLAGGSSITVHDLETGKRINTFENVSPTSNAMGMSLALNPDGTKLYVGFQSGIIVCIDPKTGEQLGTFTGHTISVYSLCLSKDGKRLFSGSADKTVRVWDTEYYIEKMAIKGHVSAIVGLNLVDNDTRLLAATHDYANADGKVYLWDIILEGLPKK